MPQRWPGSLVIEFPGSEWTSGHKQTSVGLHREAKVGGGPVTLWGSGLPRREVLQVEDLADAVVTWCDDMTPPRPSMSASAPM